MNLPPPGYPLYPLANPKGVECVCELCQRPAFLQCTLCRVTYYCSIEHQRADWVGIHEKICETLSTLRKPMPFITSEEERKKKKEELLEKQKKMIEITRTTGQKLLFQGRSEEAVPAALQCLKFTIDVHGLSSVELVPPYLILGEASIGLNRLPQAEEYLAQAQWTVLKTPQCPNAIKSQLHRKLGLLFAAKGDYDTALENLAHDIFYASSEFGTDDIRTSGGYFQMAEVFQAQNRMDIADDLYGRVTEIWSSHLKGIVEMLTFKPVVPEGIGEVVAEITQEEKETLNEAQEAEAIKVLNAIYRVRQTQEKVPHAMRPRIALALSMLYFVLNDPPKAKEFYGQCNREVDGISSRETKHDFEFMTDALDVIGVK